MPFERLQHLPTKRHPTALPIALHARLGSSLRVDALDRGDGVRPVDVFPFERKRLLGTHPGPDEEHRERPVRGDQLAAIASTSSQEANGLDLTVLVELDPAVADAVGRVAFDQLPRHRADYVGGEREGGVGVRSSRTHPLIREQPSSFARITAKRGAKEMWAHARLAYVVVRNTLNKQRSV